MPETLFMARKNITQILGELSASALRGILDLIFLPNKAYKSLDAIIRSLYRIKISKQNLLEWITSEEAEKQAKTDLLSYFKCMKPNVIVGIFGIIIGIYLKEIVTAIICLIWLIAPYFAWNISKENVIKSHNIKKQDKDYLTEIGERTWQFFKDNINEENNFLPPDNYQEDRKEKIAHRTSPTNIGLRTFSYCICIRFGL